LEEKAAAYELVDVPMMQGAHKQEPFLKRHPFGRVPAFEHDGLALYETGAITRYIDRAFSGAKLQPTDLRQLARMDQVISIIDAYAYGTLIGKIVWQRLVVPMTGGSPDEAVVKDALPLAHICVGEFERILGGAPWFGGDAVSLADLHLAPIFGYLTATPESALLLEPHPRLAAWWQRASARDSMAKTPPRFG
jgi:glutathione S-transferase